MLGRFPQLSAWMAGEVQPTLRQLEQFAKAVHVPFGYLLLAHQPDDELPIPHFRTGNNQPVRKASPNLRETIDTMQRRQSWMRERMMEQGRPKLEFVGSARLSESPERIAQRIRADLSLGPDWAQGKPNWTAALRALELSLEDQGFLVVINSVVGNNVHRKLDVDEFRGFVIVDAFAPLIFVNGSDAKAAQVFTLAHELAHVWLGVSAAFDLRNMQSAPDKSEQHCNRIAAEFLVPQAELRATWSAKAAKTQFQELARRFKVSEIVVARRALDLELISKDAFFRFYNAYLARLQNEDRGGGQFYPTQNVRIGKRFFSAVWEAVREGRLLYREAYHLTGLHGRSFETYAETISGTRR